MKDLDEDSPEVNVGSVGTVARPGKIQALG
jgi:hypothetical protein